MHLLASGCPLSGYERLGRHLTPKIFSYFFRALAVEWICDSSLKVKDFKQRVKHFAYSP